MKPGVGPPSQMLSGPDLGAGFLHQLSVEGEADPRRFTFHAQDGGADAAGPPKGPLDVLDFVHPPTACMYGGPRCWHRRFWLPFSELPKVRLAYNRNRFVLQAMIDQAYAGAKPDVEGALAELADRVAGPLAAEGIPWYVGGSAGAWLQGAHVAPRDIDLGTTLAGVARLGELLALYLIEPVAPTERAGGIGVRGARAFVGTFEKGARVEWSVRTDPKGSPSLSEFGGQPERLRLTSVRYRNHDLKVTRPEYSLVRAAERGRTEAASALAALVRELGPDLELLESELQSSHLTEPQRATVRSLVRG
jgi:hypothetical protein